jgi:hypothetical protein
MTGLILPGEVVSIEAMVGPDRVELSTSRLSGVRSNHLSYGPIAAARLAHRHSANKPAPMQEATARRTNTWLASHSRDRPHGDLQEETGEEKRRRRRARKCS